MKRQSTFLMALAFAGVLQAFSPGNASTTSEPQAAQRGGTKAAVGRCPSALVWADTAFAHEAAIGGIIEIALGKMAAVKGKGTEVKNFGLFMDIDYNRTHGELKKIASSKRIKLPAYLDAEHQKVRDDLSKLNGQEFDEAYVKAMLKLHTKDLKLMQSEIVNGSDPELKAFAAKTAAMVQKHLAMIKQLHDQMK
jgi:putative membrane protein